MKLDVATRTGAEGGAVTARAMRETRLRRWLLRCGLGLLALLLAVGMASVAANVWMILATRGAIYADIDRLPDNAVGLLLGTSPYTVSGHGNPYFRNRIEAAVRLYRAGKIRHLLVSGANPSRYYNEPQAMYQALRDAGIPAAAITLDYAGYRTLDSVVRAKRVFGQQALTIISQRSHDYRALFVAWGHGIDAIAFAAPEVALSRSLDIRVREFLARVRAVLDIYVLHAQPRYLGPPIAVDVDTGVEQIGKGSRGDNDKPPLVLSL